MLKREFKIHFKSFLIWLLVLIVMFLVVYIIYPYMITEETMKSMDELMKVFPEEVLKMFHMDMTSISTAYGWLKTEGFVFVLLIIGFYSSLLGSHILLKEESDKTIEYLGSLPISRKRIITNKIIVGMIYILSIVLLLGIFNFVALSISGDFEQKQFILLSITPIFIGFPFFSMNLFFSTFFQKTKQTIGFSLGVVFIFYILSVLSEISSNVEFLKYFTIYTLADIRNVILNVEIQPLYVVISLGLTFLFLFGTYLRYQKKELLG